MGIIWLSLFASFDTHREKAEEGIYSVMVKKINIYILNNDNSSSISSIRVRVAKKIKGISQGRWGGIEAAFCAAAKTARASPSSRRRRR